MSDFDIKDLNRRLQNCYKRNVEQHAIISDFINYFSNEQLDNFIEWRKRKEALEGKRGLKNEL